MVGSLNVTVMVKATLALVHEGPAQLIEAEAVQVDELPAGGVAGGSLARASDLAPFKGKTDVTFVGQAYPPGGQPAPTAAVRLAIYRDKALLDKTLRVYGERSAERPSPQPFRSMPVSYERAYGGATFVDNPVGMGAEARVLGVAGPAASAGLPSIVDPADPSKPGGFGPIAAAWMARRKLLGAFDPALLQAPIATLPGHDIFAYFQTAPLDQQIAYLRGDEWIVLDNLHPSLPRLSSRLPGVLGACRLYLPKADGYTPGKPINMRLDTLAIDGDQQRCSLVFRGTFSVAEGERALAGLRIACGVELAGQALSFPDPRELLPEPAPAASAPPAKKLGATAALSEEQQAWLSAQRAAPFSGQKSEAPPVEKAKAPPARSLGSTAALPDDALADLAAQKALPFGEAPPKVPVLETPRVPVAAPAPQVPVPPPAPVAPPARSLAHTVSLTDRDQRDLKQERQEGSVLPFVQGSAPAAVATSVGPKAAPRTGPLTGTAALSDDDLAALTRVDPLPFVLPAAPKAAPAEPEAPKARLQTKVPPRRSSAVPLVTDMPLSVATVGFQVRPPRESLTVVVKGTFDLVEGKPAKPREEPDPLLGDLYADDDPEKGLLYATDLAIFKPRCDVTVVGSAHAPRGSATQMQVGFRLGEGAKKVERSANVLGDRSWKTALGVALVPTDPEPFATMPLTYERAFGGPEHAPNPVGRGHKSAPELEGKRSLPNLEDPNKPIGSPGDTPQAQCFAPLAPGWKPRTRHQGTYDKKWLGTRWPYFPEDFDWQAAQHAPAAQQCDSIAGDAPYELRGMSARSPVVRGALPGWKVRCFVERSRGKGEGGGGFDELPLKLDTAHFDMDEHKLLLVWRGLLEVAEEDAPEIALLFITAEPLGGPALSLEEARARMLAAAKPAEEAVESPAPEQAPGNDVRPPAKDAPGKDAETARIEADAAREQAEREARLSAAGVKAAPGEARARSPLPEEAPAPVGDPGVRARVLAALDAGEDLNEVDLSEADLSDLDFSGRSLVGAVLLRARLVRCNFTGAKLTGAQLAGADLREARLTGATLDGADLEGATLEEANLEGASLHGTSLAKVAGRGALFGKARGVQASFVEGDWTGAMFDECELLNADFSGATLDEASFLRAEMVQVRLYDAKGKQARFDGAKLPGARAESVALTGCSLRGVEAPRSGWNKATLEGCSFVGALLGGAGFAEVKAQGVDFGGVDATEGRFGKADLRGARFLAANLMKANFEQADLTGADMRGSNLHEAETWKAKLGGAQLDLAIVTKSKLWGKKG
jgi:uncharacterized protein YjbI with pentapeptide repeats